MKDKQRDSRERITDKGDSRPQTQKAPVLPRQNAWPHYARFCGRLGGEAGPYTPCVFATFVGEEQARKRTRFQVCYTSKMISRQELLIDPEPHKMRQKRILLSLSINNLAKKTKTNKQTKTEGFKPESFISRYPIVHFCFLAHTDLNSV